MVLCPINIVECCSLNKLFLNIRYKSYHWKYIMEHYASAIVAIMRRVNLSIAVMYVMRRHYEILYFIFLVGSGIHYMSFVFK